MSDSFNIRFLSTADDDDIKAIRMPLIEFVGPIFMPPDHATLDAHEVPPPPLSASHGVEITMDLSWESIHGFPLLCNAASDKRPHFSTRNDVRDDKYGAQISATYGDRLFRTWWRPQVVVGRPCTHRDEYNRMTRCSLTSRQVLLQVKPSRRNEPLESRWLQTDVDMERDNDEQARSPANSLDFLPAPQRDNIIPDRSTGPFRARTSLHRSLFRL